MERARIRAFLLASAAAAALAGCEMASTTDSGTPAVEDAPVARAATSVRLVDRDVEAPQVFQVTDSALWDGRPSLGGVWVASPDATDPERVILRNPTNGKFVIGALFRRERLNPGPTLQISSDAAAALDILAGQPTKLSVTALRREEAEPAAAPEAAKPILDTNEAVATTELAAAAIDKAEGKEAPVVAAAPPSGKAAKGKAPAAAEAAVAEGPAAGPAQGKTPEGASGDELAATELAAAEATAEPAPKKRKGWLFKRRKAEAGVETASLPAGEGIETTALLGADGKVPAATAAAGPAPLSALKPVVAKPATGRAALIQIGIFSVDANADRAVKLLKAKGIAARKLTETSQGKTFWRVVADAPDRTATLASVKAAGFADAYPVTR